ALIEAVRRVNPTARGLDPALEASAYAVKSRLQARLIADHADALAVELDPATPGAVLLRHRYEGRHACHALIDSLDIDARAWVRFQLDVADDGRRAGPPRGALRPDRPDPRRPALRRATGTARWPRRRPRSPSTTTRSRSSASMRCWRARRV